jgi:hypothetical protein
LEATDYLLEVGLFVFGHGWQDHFHCSMPRTRARGLASGPQGRFIACVRFPECR